MAIGGGSHGDGLSWRRGWLWDRICGRGIVMAIGRVVMGMGCHR